MSQFSLCFLRNIELASDVTTNKFKCSGAWCFINCKIYCISRYHLAKGHKMNIFSICTFKIIKTIFFGITALDRHYHFNEHPTSVQITHYISAAHKNLQIIVVDPTKVHVVFDIPSVFWTVTFEVLQSLRNRHL